MEISTLTLSSNPFQGASEAPWLCLGEDVQGTALMIKGIMGIASGAWCAAVVRADTVCMPIPKAHSVEAGIGAEATGVPLCEDVE